ncbi:unnamed protein product [Ectocarpus sp. 12 AP-2014]
MLEWHLTKIQQAVNAATKAQEQQSLRNAKSAASLQQATAAFLKAGDGKKLGRPPAHDHPTGRAAELPTWRRRFQHGPSNVVLGRCWGDRESGWPRPVSCNEGDDVIRQGRRRFEDS